jgi:hypothetical protein
MLEISSQNHETDLNLSFNPRFLRNLKSGGIVPSIPGGCQCARTFRSEAV